MVLSDSFQALSAAFTFGTVLQAAGPAILLFTKGHGKAIFRDGRRLALVFFLIFAALWSQVEFVALMMPTTMTNICAITVIASTALDQLARVMLEQFLLWSVGHGTKMTKVRIALQILLLLRIAAGGVLVGFTRIDYAPTCLAQTSQLPVGIVALGLDSLIFVVLFIRAFSLGFIRGMRSEVKSEKQYSRALVFTILGLGVWTGTSVPMILGIPGIILLLRTVVPANGLLLVASIIIGFSIALLVVKEEEGLTQQTPESRSPPFMNPMQPTREIFQENSSTSGTPIIPTGYPRGSLFVVNPSSATPLSTPMFSGNGKNGDTRGFTKLNDNATVMDMGNGSSARLEVPTGSRHMPGYRGTDGYFVSTPNQPVVHGALVPPSRPSLAVITGSETANQSQRSFFGRTKTTPVPSIRNLKISQPLAVNADGTSSMPFANVPTVDLETAAKMESQRRQEAAARLKSMGVPVAQSGATTSASLSPGRDALRRRSPGKGNGFGLSIDEKIDLQPELERRTTIGLPSNPRAQRGPMAREIGMAKEQTVMRVNEIVYDQPGLVNDISNNAALMYANRPKTAGAMSFSEATGGLKSSGSIIHRPRGYKKVEVERVHVPSEPSRGLSLRRSKSSSSLVRQSSVSKSQPGIPTNLPALPPPPTSAANLTKLLPNKRGDDLDEKMEFLFPAPPGANIQYRKSSVPTVPPVPAAFMAQTPPSAWTNDEQGSRPSSKRTSQTSVESDQFDLASSIRDSEILKDEPYLLNPTTYQMNTSSNAFNVAKSSLLEVPDRQSIIDDVRKSQLTEASLGNESMIDEAIEDWSTTTNVPDIEISKATENAQPTFSQRVKVLMEEKLNILVSPRPVATQAPSAESIPLMLDPEDSHHSTIANPVANEETFFLDDAMSPSESQPAPVRRSWHKRVGDELPTFIGRIKSVRKMPPPTPLLLSRNGRRPTIVVRNAEISPPADSPERALQEIQKQLQRFEGSNRGSVGSLLDRLPNVNQDLENLQDNERLRLLENLEMEIGQQESLRQQIHTDLDRDSILITTPQQISSLKAPSQRSSQSQLLDRRSRMKSIVPKLPKNNDTPLIENSNSTSAWQQRLANAQNEYTAKATNTARKSSLNFLSVYKAPAGPISPTPPDSVASSETESESESEDGSSNYDEGSNYVQETQATPKKASFMWQQPIASPILSQGSMWNQPHKRSVTESSHEPPAKNIRPVQRHVQQSLQIFSTKIWSKPVSAEHSRPIVGLWGSKLVRPKSIITRPVTQRPARRSRRTTFLPDIVESPVPLPNKTETLGLYQYPWGETSDQAVYQPAFNPALLNEAALTSQFDQRSRQLEPESYSSSFFDDYEASEDEDEEVSEQDSEDEFDESTLWEIASLLKSNDVPSKQSLFLPRAEEKAVVDDYESDYSVSEDIIEINSTKIIETSSSVQASRALVEVPTSPSESLQRPASNMWSPPKAVIQPTTSGLFSKPANSISKRGSEAMPAALQMLKAPRKSTAEVPSLSSSNLWAPMERSQQEVVWITKDIVTSKAPSTPKVVKPTQTSAMWSMAEKIVETGHTGMFDAFVPRVSYRRTISEPAAINMVSRPRKTQASLESLSSNKLWLKEQKMKTGRNWISESGAQISSSFEISMPALVSPSTRIATIQVAEVPVTVSPISVAAVSKAIELSSPIEATEPTIKIPIPQDKPSSKIPTRQSFKPLALNRESRMLASRAMFESKAPPAVPPPVLNYRRATMVKKPAKPTRQAFRQQFVPNGTFQSNWDEALMEAENASKIKPKMKRVLSRFNKYVEESAVQAKAPRFVKQMAMPVAKSVVVEKVRVVKPNVPHEKVDWDAALEEAVAMSVVPEVVAVEIVSEAVQRFNAAIMHPVFFTESRESAIMDIHPAALGYFSAKAIAISMVVKAVQPLPVNKTSALWTSPFKVTELKNTGTWMKKANTVVNLPSRFENGKETQLRAKSSKPESLPQLNSTALFQRTRSTATNIDWLHLTSKTTMPISVATLASETPIFSASQGPELEEDLLSEILSKQIEEELLAYAATLSPVSSASSALASTEPEVLMLENSMMWSATVKNVTSDNAGMWIRPAEQALPAPDMLSNSGTGRRATVSQVAQLPQLLSSSLFVPSKPISSRRDWLHSTSRSFRVPALISAPAPAASAPVSIEVKPSKTSASTTWSAPQPRKLTKDITGMWNKPAEQASLVADMFTSSSGAQPRATVKQQVQPVQLSSTSLFVASKAVSNVRDWLHSTSRSSIYTPIPVASVPLSKKIETIEVKPSAPMMWTATQPRKITSDVTGMWDKSAEKALLVPDMFINSSRAHPRAKSAQTSGLAQLLSSPLFTPSKPVSSTRDWLRSTSKDVPIAFSPVAGTPIVPAVAIPSRKRATTWIAPIITPTSTSKSSSSSMWTAQTIPHSLPSPMLFSDMNEGPVNRAKRADSAVVGLESTELWKQEEKVGKRERNWSVGEEK